MITRLKLHDGRKATVEQTMTSIRLRYDDEPEAHVISTEEYMNLVWKSTPIGEIN